MIQGQSQKNITETSPVNTKLYHNITEIENVPFDDKV